MLAPQVLRRFPAFRRLWLARVTSFIGDGIALVALLLYVKQTQDSGLATGLLLLALSVPRVLGPLTGAVADRADQRLVLIVCDLGQALIFAAIAIVQPGYPVLLALLFAASTLSGTFSPASRSAVTRLVDEEHLLPANAWLGLALNLQVAVGPFVGGLLFDGLGLRGALLVDAMTFAASASLVGGLPRLRSDPNPDSARHTLITDVRRGLAFTWSHRVARAVIVALFLGVLFASVENVALVFLARDVLGTSPIGFGTIATANGVGMLLSSVALIRWSPRGMAATLFSAGWVLSGVGILGTGLAPAVGVAVLAQAVAGAGNGVENVAGDTLLQTTVPHLMLGRVFGLAGAAAFLADAITFPLAGFVLDVTSPRTVLLIGGAGTLCTVVILNMMLRGPGSNHSVN